MIWAGLGWFDLGWIDLALSGLIWADQSGMGLVGFRVLEEERKSISVDVMRYFIGWYRFPFQARMVARAHTCTHTHSLDSPHFQP